VDELVFVKRSYHEACALIERTNKGSYHVHDVYAEPRTPIPPPIEWPPIPPGRSSWTTTQYEPVENATQPQHWAVAGTQIRLQSFLSIRPSPIELSPGIPIPIALRHCNQSNLVGAGGRTASNPLPARVALRFRPARSGHGTGCWKPICSIMLAAQILTAMRFQCPGCKNLVPLYLHGHALHQEHLEQRAGARVDRSGTHTWRAVYRSLP